MPANKLRLCKLGARYAEYLHDNIVAVEWAGDEPIATHDVRSMDLLESAMAQPFASAFGEDAYLDATTKAAALFRSLVANHPFGNGNKRTAVVAVAYFLLANGFILNLSNDQMYELARQTARYKLRQLSHDEALAEVAESLRDSTTSFGDIKRQAVRNKSVADLYWIVTRMRSRIRKDSMNELMPSAQDRL